MTAGMKPIGQMFAPRVFWLVMPYRCEHCGHAIDFYLEEGCEGPNDVPFDHVIETGPFKGQTTKWSKTASGRVIVPVPFVAGACPLCHGPPPWKLGTACLIHSGADRRLSPRPLGSDLPAGTARFHYPKDLKDPHACGMPVYPPYLMRGEA